MHDYLMITIALPAGVLLGLFFFGGLWWTVRRAVKSGNPALWFAASMLLRTAGTLAGFYFLCGGDWRRFAACLAGFIFARGILTRAAGSAREDKEAAHAPES